MILRRVRPGERPWPDRLQLPDVGEIVDEVRAGGDDALARIAARLGDPPPRVVPAAEIEAAARAIDEPMRRALAGAAERIERFARLQRASLNDVTARSAGMTAGHQVLPLRRVGIYVPAGRYPLPSTVLMCAIPARVAGVREIVMCTPRAVTETLAAASLAGVDRCIEAGGAQAIAAMAYGTGSIPRVDLIAGPGNAYVTAAKRRVYGDCGIDMLAGPSEVVVIASADADPALAAADLLAQAEHDAQARTLLLADDQAFARAVDREIARQLRTLATASVASAALEANGACAILPLTDAALWANELAPEHLQLQGANAEALVPHLYAYGTLFVGSSAAEVFADYGVGPNHVLPTGSTARFSCGLSVFTFLRARTFLRAGGPVAPGLIEQTEIFAAREGLDGHRRAAAARAHASAG